MASTWHPSDVQRAALASNPWFASLPAPVREDLVACGRPRLVAAEQRLFSRGDVPDGIYAVLEGSIRVGGISRDGRETVLDFHGPGDWLGVLSQLDGQPRGHDAVAHGAAVLLHVGPADLEHLLAARPGLARAFLVMVSRRLREALVSLEAYSVQSLEQRLASRLLVLARRFGVAGSGLAGSATVRIELHLPQEMLARLTGSTRQRVNQILKEWDALGLAKHQYGRLVLLDLPRLRQLAQL